MPSQEKQISVDVSNENKVKENNNNNVGPSLLYLQGYQQRVPNENELERYLRCRGGRAWEIMERKQRRAFGDQTERGFEGWQGNREGEEGEVGSGR